MFLTELQTLILIGAVALGAVLTRLLPFLLFPDHRKPPEYILYLGRVLAPAMMGLLVIYCLKDISFRNAPNGIPELLAVGGVVLLHRWKRNTLLSIGAGTLLYMLLVQVVFV